MSLSIGRSEEPSSKPLTCLPKEQVCCDAESPQTTTAQGHIHLHVKEREPEKEDQHLLKREITPCLTHKWHRKYWLNCLLFFSSTLIL